MFASCSSNKNLLGVYTAQSGHAILQLNADSSFLYQYKFQYEYRYSTGVWGLQDGKIVLNSRLASKELPLDIEAIRKESPAEKVSLIIFTDVSERYKAFYNYSIYVNGVFVSSIKEGVNYPFVASNARNLVIKVSADERMPSRFFDTLVTAKYSIPDRGNQFKAYVRNIDSFGNYQVFKNASFAIQKNKISGHNSMINGDEVFKRKQ